MNSDELPETKTLISKSGKKKFNQRRTAPNLPQVNVSCEYAPIDEPSTNFPRITLSPPNPSPAGLHKAAGPYRPASNPCKRRPYNLIPPVGGSIRRRGCATSRPASAADTNGSVNSDLELTSQGSQLGYPAYRGAQKTLFLPLRSNHLSLQGEGCGTGHYQGGPSAPPTEPTPSTDCSITYPVAEIGLNSKTNEGQELSQEPLKKDDTYENLPPPPSYEVSLAKDRGSIWRQDNAGANRSEPRLLSILQNKNKSHSAGHKPYYNLYNHRQGSRVPNRDLAPHEVYFDTESSDHDFGLGPDSVNSATNKDIPRSYRWDERSQKQVWDPSRSCQSITEWFEITKRKRTPKVAGSGAPSQLEYNSSGPRDSGLTDGKFKGPKGSERKSDSQMALRNHMGYSSSLKEMKTSKIPQVNSAQDLEHTDAIYAKVNYANKLPLWQPQSQPGTGSEYETSDAEIFTDTKFESSSNMSNNKNNDYQINRTNINEINKKINSMNLYDFGKHASSRAGGEAVPQRIREIQRCMSISKTFESRIRNIEVELHRNYVVNGKKDVERENKLHRNRKFRDRPPIRFEQELEYSGLHGISILLNSGSSVRRVAWIVLLISLFLLAVIHTAATVFRAAKSPTQFKVSYESTQKLAFPDFTICSHYGVFLNITRLSDNFHRRRAGRLPSVNGSSEIDMEEWIAISQAIPDIGYVAQDSILPSDIELADLDLAEGLKRINARYANNLLTAVQDVIDRYMLPCSSVFGKCYSDERVMNCCEIFAPLYNAFFGPCYHANVSLIEPGSSSSIMRSSKHLTWVEMKNWSDPMPAKTSVEAEAQKVSGLSFQLGKEQWINTPSGILPHSRYQIGLDIRKVKDMKLKGRCLGKTETKLELFAEYTSYRCLPEKLLLRYFLPCSWPLFNILNPDFVPRRPICNYPTNHTFEELSEFADRAINDDIRKACLYECERWEFSTNDWEKTSDYTGDEIILFVFFTSPSYTIFEEVQTLTWVDYLSMVGGLWGLWLGSSIITMINIVESAILVSFRNLKNYYLEKRKVKETTIINGPTKPEAIEKLPDES